MKLVRLQHVGLPVSGHS